MVPYPRGFEIFEPVFTNVDISRSDVVNLLWCLEKLFGRDYRANLKHES